MNNVVGAAIVLGFVLALVIGVYGAGREVYKQNFLYSTAIRCLEQEQDIKTKLYGYDVHAVYYINKLNEKTARVTFYGYHKETIYRMGMRHGSNNNFN